MSALTRTVPVALMILVAGLATTACGDDDSSATSPVAAPTAATPEPSPEPTPESEAAKIAGYCAGVAAAEKRGGEVFAGVDENDAAAMDKAERTMLEYVRANAVASDVPEEIRADSEAFLAGYVTRIESGDKIQPTAAQSAAEERVLAWEEKNCAKQ